jgi:hypothetical protein
MDLPGLLQGQLYLYVCCWDMSTFVQTAMAGGTSDIISTAASMWVVTEGNKPGEEIYLKKLHKAAKEKKGLRTHSCRPCPSLYNSSNARERRLCDRQLFANSAAAQTPGRSRWRFRVTPAFPCSTLSEKTRVTKLYWIYDSGGVLWMGVGTAHISKNMLLCIGLRSVWRTLFIGAPSPLSCYFHTPLTELNLVTVNASKGCS